MSGHDTPIPMTASQSGPLSGVAEIPGDKSISHRSLILGALSVGETKITGLLEGEDVLDTARAMRAFGAEVTQHGAGRWSVHGVGVGGFSEPADLIDCGNSGTGVRLIMGAMATTAMTATFTGDASLRKRPMGRVTDPLALFGAQAYGRKGGRLPMTVVGAADLPAEVRARSLHALRRLATVEAGLHGVGLEEVHFHELGAVDTLVDVVGAFALVHALGVGRCVHAPVPVGSGRVRTEHGELGVPAPATLALLQGRPIAGGPERVEVTTPTGALLLSELAAGAGPLPAMVVERVGYGAGHRRLASGPNLLRVVLGSEAAGSETAEPEGSRGDHVVLLETVVDDASPEVLGHLFERLRREGALEVWWSPAYMKKSRPAVALSALCAAEDEQRLVEIVFAESGTFGVRRAVVERHVLARSWVSVEVEGVPVRVKVGHWGDRVVTLAPEFDDVAAVAEASGLPLREVVRAAHEAVRSTGV